MSCTMVPVCDSISVGDALSLYSLVFCMMVPVSDSISVGDALSLYSHVFWMMVPVSDNIALVHRYDYSGPKIDML